MIMTAHSFAVCISSSTVHLCAIEPHSKARADSKTCLGWKEGIAHPDDVESVAHCNYWVSQKYQDEIHSWAFSKSEMMNDEHKYTNEDAIDSVGKTLAISASPEKIWHDLRDESFPFNFMAQIPNEPWHTLLFGVLTWLFNVIWQRISSAYPYDLQVFFVRLEVSLNKTSNKRS